MSVIFTVTLGEDEFDWRSYLLDDAEEEVIGIPSENQDAWVSSSMYSSM